MRDSRDSRDAYSAFPAGGAWNQTSSSGLTQDQMAELMRRVGASTPQQAIEWARRMPIGAGTMNGDGPAGTPAPQYLLFGLGSLACALPTEVVLAVEWVPDIAHVPNLADWVLGVVQVRGEIVSVVDLHRFFGLPAQAPTPQSRLIVARLREMVIGFLVDFVHGMRSPSGGNVIPDRTNVPTWAQPYAQGTIPGAEQPTIVLDPETLLFGEKMHHYRADML